MQEKEDDALMAIEPYNRKAVLNFVGQGAMELLVNVNGVQALVTAMNIGGILGLTEREARLKGPPEIFILDMSKVSAMEIVKAPSAQIIPVKPGLLVPV